jgi:hypothetical protein
MHCSCDPNRQRNEGKEHSACDTREFRDRERHEPERCMNTEQYGDQQEFVSPTLAPPQQRNPRQKEQDHRGCGKYEDLLSVGESIVWQGDDQDDRDEDDPCCHAVTGLAL